MPGTQSMNIFPLLNEFSTNDQSRPGTQLLEYFQVDVTIAINTGDVEVPTNLGSVLGVINLNYSSVFAAGDAIDAITTDGVITSGAVTVRVKTTSIADGSLTIRGYLVGTKSETQLSLG